MKRCSKEKRTGSRSSPFRWLQALSSSRLLFACSPSLATEVEVDAVLAMQLRRTLKRTTRQSHQGLPGTRATTACAPYASNSAGLVRRPCAATDSARPASSRRGSVGTAQGRSHSPAPAAARPGSSHRLWRRLGGIAWAIHNALMGPKIRSGSHPVHEVGP